MVGPNIQSPGAGGRITPPPDRSSASSRVRTPTSSMPVDVLRHVARGQDAAREAHLRGLAHAQGGLAGAAHLARQADLAEDDRPRGQGPVPERRRDGRRDAEVGRRLRHLQAAGDAHEHVVAEELRGPTRFSSTARSSVVRLASRPMRHAARRCRTRSARRGPGSRPAWDASPRRWPPPPSPASPASRSDRNSAEGLGTGLQARARHLEDAQLGDRAEAVLDGAHDAVVLVLLALEVEDGVHDVLEGLGPGQAAVLGHVADEEGRDPAALGQHEELGRDLAHLADAAGRGREARRVDRSARSRRPAPRA